MSRFRTAKPPARYVDTLKAAPLVSADELAKHHKVRHVVGRYGTTYTAHTRELHGVRRWRE